MISLASVFTCGVGLPYHSILSFTAFFASAFGKIASIDVFEKFLVSKGFLIYNTYRRVTALAWRLSQK
jgi:hypothetical protein